jgi:thiamine-monophosphate kinase
MANDDAARGPRDAGDARRASGAGADGEFELIRRLTKNLPPGRGVIVGPGDDAAVLRPDDGLDLVVTTDAIVVDQHICRGWFEGDVPFAQAIGTRLAAANLSDLAAMAALPRWAVLSAGIAAADKPMLEIMERALAESLARDGAALVGGNLARVEGPAWFSLTLIGEVEHDRAWTRRGARPGDLIAVTGSPGLAGMWSRLAKAMLMIGSHALIAGGGAVDDAWSRPRSRIEVARALALTNAVRAAIDISDGLNGDLAHLCEAGGVGADIEDFAWPDDALFETTAEYLFTLVSNLPGLARSDPSSGPVFKADKPPFMIDELRYGPSDDYELLLAIDPVKREACAKVAADAGAPLTFIGRFTAAPGTLTRIAADGTRTPLPGAGFDHFAKPDGAPGR